MQGQSANFILLCWKINQSFPLLACFVFSAYFSPYLPLIFDFFWSFEGTTYFFFFLNEAVEFFLSPMWFDKYVNSVGKYPISSAGERLLISFSTGELTGWAWGLSWPSPSLQEWYQGIGWLGCLTFLTPSRQFLFSSYMFCVSELLVISDTEAETPDPLFLS